MLLPIQFSFIKVALNSEEAIEQRWPSKLFYGPQGHLKHSYSRCTRPNLKKRSARYRCKSYRTYECSAKLQILEVDGCDKYIMTGEHTTVCKANNGIKPENADGMDSGKDVKIEDISAQFKKRCADLAVEKIWLQPLKIWELVRDDMVPKIANGVVVPSSDQVSFESLYIIVYVCNVLHL